MSGRDDAAVAAHLTHLARVLGAPTTAVTWGVLTTRPASTSLARQVLDGGANGRAIRTGGAHFPAMKTLERDNGKHQAWAARGLAQLASGAFVDLVVDLVLSARPRWA